MDNYGHYRSEVGKLGEEEVVAYLLGRGHAILEQNWRSRHLEIDIISFDAEGVHFVEVKSRRSDGDVNPQERVGHAKERNVAAAAARYMRLKGLDAECHFDVACVVFNEFGTEVRYIPDAFIPIYV